MGKGRRKGRRCDDWGGWSGHGRVRMRREGREERARREGRAGRAGREAGGMYARPLWTEWQEEIPNVIGVVAIYQGVILYEGSSLCTQVK